MKHCAVNCLLGGLVLTGSAIAQDGDAALDPAASSDDPPPSMALLEFVALFETKDGKWMDLTEIPEQLDQAIAPAAPAHAPNEDAGAVPPATDVDAEQPPNNQGSVLGAN